VIRSQTESSAKAGSEAQNSAPAPPAIGLPKGGGAIRGMGEKFAANPVTGTGAMTMPIATSPGRGGFGPQFSVSYDSGVGNGPFGLGWNLSLPAITRKTDKGLPKYHDADDSDVFILFGAEDLVPLLQQDAKGKWVPEDLPLRNVNGVDYRIHRYRPRLEGLFARIERWTSATDANDVFWRSISKDNITTGTARLLRAASRIHPTPPAFSPGSSARAMTTKATSSHTGTKRKTLSASTWRKHTSATGRENRSQTRHKPLPQARPLRQRNFAPG